MAGTEFSGIQHALPNMFQGAHYILTPDEGTQPEHLALMERVARHLGCADVVRTTPEQHDAIIGLYQPDDAHHRRLGVRRTQLSLQASRGTPSGAAPGWPPWTSPCGPSSSP